MKSSTLVERISGPGADAWNTRGLARAARGRGGNVICLAGASVEASGARLVRPRAFARNR